MEKELPQRRKDDYPDEDHRRDREFDWRLLAPRWALVTGLGLSFLSIGWLLGKNAALDDERIAIMERYRSDARWDLIAKLNETMAKQGVLLNQHEAQLDKISHAMENIAELRSDIKDLRRIVEREARK